MNILGIVIPDWAVILSGLGAAAVVVKYIAETLGLIDKAFAALSNILNRLRRKSTVTPGVPAKTLAVIPEPRINALWWSMGAAGNTPLMQVVADFYVTNVSDRPVKLAGGLLRVSRWLFSSRTERGDTAVKDLQSPYSGNYAIPSHQMTRVRVHFHFTRPFVKPKKAFNCRIALLDQYGNEHWVHVRFKHIEAMLE